MSFFERPFTMVAINGKSIDERGGDARDEVLRDAVAAGLVAVIDAALAVRLGVECKERP